MIEELRLRVDNGQVTTDHWPEEIVLDEHFLHRPDPHWRVDKNKLIFDLANGYAEYLLLTDRPAPAPGLIHAGRLYARLDGADG